MGGSPAVGKHDPVGVWGLGVTVWGFGCGVWSSGFRVRGSEFGVRGSEFGVWVWVLGFGFWVLSVRVWGQQFVPGQRPQPYTLNPHSKPSKRCRIELVYRVQGLGGCRVEFAPGQDAAVPFHLCSPQMNVRARFPRVRGVSKMKNSEKLSSTVATETNPHPETAY